MKDRALVAKRMREHVADAAATPLLVFPEGTCVNNEYTVMFKRGAFDLGATVCPIAIKYNKIFVDAFWNSRRQPFTIYIVRRCRPAIGRRFPKRSRSPSTSRAAADLLAARRCCRPARLRRSRLGPLPPRRSSLRVQAAAHTCAMLPASLVPLPLPSSSAATCQSSPAPFADAAAWTLTEQWGTCAQFKLMVSWALVADVYFLPPQTQRDDESAQAFAERVQARLDLRLVFAACTGTRTHERFNQSAAESSGLGASLSGARMRA